MNLVDSSAWLEYFDDGVHAKVFEDAIIDVHHLIVPAICLYEVYKRFLITQSEDKALLAVASMRQGRVVDLDAQLSFEAAHLSMKYRLPMADSMILATAQRFEAVIWTKDAHFKNITNVKYFA